MSLNADIVVTEVTVSAGAGGTALLSINSNRTFLAVHNIEDQAMSFTVDGTTPTTATGFYLAPGAAWTFDDVVPKGAVKAISHSGSKKARVSEGT